MANTGRGIPIEEQPYIFERFHRAGAGDDVPGHGLGLNLARELARLHGGDLRLVRSDGKWTEFCAIFCAADVGRRNQHQRQSRERSVMRARSSAPVCSPSPPCPPPKRKIFLTASITA